jgi:hypothetical protein
MPSPGGTHLSGFIFTLLIAVLVLALRNRRPRRLRLEAMWIRPLIFFVLIGLTLSATTTPTDPLALAVMGLSLVLGVGAGWMRGRLMRIDVHPDTYELTSRASTVGMLFILALLAGRMFIRGAAADTSILGIPAAAIADAFILFAAAMMITQSLEMFLRARRLLGEARAASVPPSNRPIVS